MARDLDIDVLVHPRAVRSLSVQRLLGALFCIFALMPWLSFNLNNLDSQPWSIFFGIAFIASFYPKILVPRYIIWIVLFLGLGFLISIFATMEFKPAIIGRAFLSYLSVPLIYAAFYHYLRKFGFPWKIFIAVNMIWIIAGIVEIFFPDFIELLAKQRTTADRGVTSLAPEPTFFALYLFFSSWILLEVVNFKLSRPVLALIGVNFISILFLAESTMIVLFYGIAGIFFLWYRIIPLRISKRAAFLLVMIFVAMALGVVLGWEALEESRIVKIGSFLFKEFSIIELLLWDASINQRAEALVVSLLGAFHHGFFPAGLDTFLVTRDSMNYDLLDVFWYPTTSAKIMSWVGAVFYELGAFGIAALGLLFFSSYQGSRRSRVSLILLFIILLSAIPLAFPLVPMLFALFAAKKHMAGSLYLRAN